MKKGLLFFIAFFVFILDVNALDFPVSISSSNGIVGSLDEKAIMYTKDIDDNLSIYSLTKIMSIYVTIDNVDNLDQFIIIDENDINGLDGMNVYGLNAGDNYTYYDLIYCSYLLDGNDCTKTLANHVFNDYDTFLNKMNEYLSDMGVSNTKFVDVYGIDGNNKSTMKDLYNIIYYMFNDVYMMNILKSNFSKLSNGSFIYGIVDSSNSKYINSLKIGYDYDGNEIILSICNLSGRHYLIIFKGDDVFLDITNMVDYISNNRYNSYTLFKKDDVLRRIEVLDGTASEYVLKYDSDIVIVVNDDEYSKLNYDYHIVNVIDPGYKKGDSLGYYNVMIGDQVLYRYDVNLDSNIGSIKKDNKIFVIIISIVLITINKFQHLK